LIPDVVVPLLLVQHAIKLYDNIHQLLRIRFLTGSFGERFPVTRPLRIPYLLSLFRSTALRLHAYVQNSLLRKEQDSPSLE
jgi:hypothetical protein